MPPHPTERILGAVRELLETKGSSALSLRRVSQVSGLSVGTINHYFGSRRGLLESALDGWHALATDAIRALSTAGSSNASRSASRVLVGRLTRTALANRPAARLRAMAWMINWRLPDVRRSETTTNLAIVAALPWSKRWSAQERRVLSLCMSFAVQRFACMDDEELLAFTETHSVDEAHNIIEGVMQHLLDAVALEPDSPSDSKGTT